MTEDWMSTTYRDFGPQERANLIANFARNLASLTALDADTAMMMADDILADEDEQRARMILDGMRAGIQQAQEVNQGARVVTIWFDGRASRATFSWDPSQPTSPKMHEAIASALNSALRASETDDD